MKKNRKLDLGKIIIASIRNSTKIKGGSPAGLDTETCTHIVTLDLNTCANTCDNYTCGGFAECETITVDTTVNNHTVGCPPPLG